MNEYGIWKTIKIGFWLGIGFIVPQLIVMYADRFFSYALYYGNVN
jgi:hypothetical protein